jgi:nitroreductase/NAD-dependent dihydropyrimidine dehydrogenase PreA subunit
MNVQQMETKRYKGELLERLKEHYTETEEVILSRRSVRWYKDEQVPEFMVKRILEAGRFAPSAGNCQPWKFVVVRDQDIIDGLTRTVISVCRFFKAVLEFRTPGNYWKLPIAKLCIRLLPAKMHPVPFSAISLIADEKLGLYHSAKTVILIFKDVRGIVNPDLDCGIAGQNMVLAAHSMGLGTCWVSFTSLAFDYTSKWKRVLGVRYPYRFVTSLAIGWPVGKPDGPVERTTHPMDWYENGTKTTLDSAGGDSRIGSFERRGIPNYKKPSDVSYGRVSFDYDKCNGCTSCARVCPARSIEMKDKKPVMTATGECMSCGDCGAICERNAITVTSDYRFTKHFKTIDHGDLKTPRM